MIIRAKNERLKKREKEVSKMLENGKERAIPTMARIGAGQNAPPTNNEQINTPFLRPWERALLLPRRGDMIKI